MSLPIHIVNLESRPDRKTRLLQELEKHGITNYHFVKAVNGSTLNLQEMESAGLIAPVRNMARGGYGCYLTHMNILKAISDSPEEIHLILEDDAFFVKNFQSKLAKLIAKNIDWDVFYVGLSPECCRVNEPLVGDKRDGIYKPVGLLYGTHGYLVKKSSAKRILELLSPIQTAYDLALSALDVKKLALVNTIVKVYRDSDSDTVGIK